MLAAEDIIAIHDLISLYGHIIDERQFSRLDELFTRDTVYDVSRFGSGVHIGIEAIRTLWLASEDKHPLAHHATNVIVSQDAAGTVRVVSKGIGVRSNGMVGTTVYDDIVIRTARGWRIAERVARRRTPETIPQPS